MGAALNMRAKLPCMATADPMPPPFDPIRAALERAPIGEPFTPEQEAELAQDLEDIRTGRARLVPHEERAAALEEIARTLTE
jgi:hypothetical protein